jgi:hypothetical protein
MKKLCGTKANWQDSEMICLLIEGHEESHRYGHLRSGEHFFAEALLALEDFRELMNGETLEDFRELMNGEKREGEKGKGEGEKGEKGGSLEWRNWAKGVMNCPYCKEECVKLLARGSEILGCSVCIFKAVDRLPEALGVKAESEDWYSKGEPNPKFTVSEVGDILKGKSPRNRG